MKKAFFLCIYTFILLLAGCASQMPVNDTVQNFSHIAWQEEGVFGYREAGKGFSAGYIWQNQPGSYTIQLIGPLGAWRAKLSGDVSHATLSMSNGKVLRAANPEKLMMKNLGWFVPVVNLQYWLHATANPNLPGFVTRKKNGEVIKIQQASWVIEYPAYKDFGDVTLPSRIILKQGNKVVTIVVNHFDFSGTD